MEPGELELRKAFEEVTTKNVKAILEYSKTTRAGMRELEEKIVKLEKQVIAQNEIIESIKVQLANVQTKVYREGT